MAGFETAINTTKAAFIVLCVGLIVFIIGFATDYWNYGGFFHYYHGLWVAYPPGKLPNNEFLTYYFFVFHIRDVHMYSLKPHVLYFCGISSYELAFFSICYLLSHIITNHSVSVASSSFFSICYSLSHIITMTVIPALHLLWCPLLHYPCPYYEAIIHLADYIWHTLHYRSRLHAGFLIVKLSYSATIL